MSLRYRELRKEAEMTEESRKRLADVVRDLKPGETYEIRTSKGKVFGTIGVLPEESADAQKAVSCEKRSQKRSSWFD